MLPDPSRRVGHDSGDRDVHDTVVHDAGREPREPGKRAMHRVLGQEKAQVAIGRVRGDAADHVTGVYVLHL